MIEWFARHPTAANLFMAAIMILGLVSLSGLQRETFPQIKNQDVEVRILYPGATAEEVEDALCRRLEDSLEGISDLDEMRCDAREGLGTATVSMREGAQMFRFLDDVKSEVDAIDDFPDGIEPPVVRELARTDAVISVAVTGPDDPVALKAYAERLKAGLLGLGRVAEVEVVGFSDHQIRIEIPAERLRRYGLSAADIAQAIQRQSVGRPVGRIEGGDEDVLLRFDDQRKDVDALRDLVAISGTSGAVIRLGEIATITDRFERDEDKVLFDGRRAAVLNVTKTRAEDTLKVYDAVAQFVAAEQALAPEGVSLTLTQDRSSLVRDRLQMLVRNGLQGLALVFLTLWLFFGARYSFWVTMGLPVSFLGALFVLPHLGVTINMLSMVGLLIGVGLLMDDAIVIAENVAARLAKGDTPMRAAIDGTRQVLPGVLSSFATTILVFGSLAFISGNLGQVLRVIPIVLILVVAVSLIEAFLILPSHLGHALAKPGNPNGFEARFRRRFESGFGRFRDRWFGPTLDAAVDHRYLTLGLALMLLLLAVAMPAGGFLKFVAFPELDGDVLEVRVLLPQGTPLARTEQVVGQVTAALGRVDERFRPRQPDDQDLVQHVTLIYGQNPDAYESGPHVARVVVDLLGAEVRDAPLDEVIAAWREETGDLADVIALKFTEPAFGPAGRAIDLRLKGDDLERLKAASLELQAWLNQYAGVQDLTDDLRPGKREYRLRLRPEAGTLGLDARGVADQVGTAFQGQIIDEFPVGPERYELELRLAADDRLGPDDLEGLVVTGRNGAQVPLAEVATIEEVRGWARIHRIDRHRAVTIQGDIDRHLANAQELIALAQRDFQPVLAEHYPEVRWQVQGESDEAGQTGKSLIRNVLLGMVGVYILLALQFRGYLAPLTVMAVIPMALIGVVFGHMALGLDLTMPSMVGMASLFGVVVNDSILLVVFIREARERGVSVLDAAKESGRARFRPILLTSITTVAGLAPLLLEQSLQAQILIPLATSLAFGLTTATVAALFLVPAIYTILDDYNALGQLHAEPDEAAGGEAVGESQAR